MFAIAALGYLAGRIEVNGISLGTAGLLLVALLYGILVNSVPLFTVNGADIILFDAAIKGNYCLVFNLGTTMFVPRLDSLRGQAFSGRSIAIRCSISCNNINHNLSAPIPSIYFQFSQQPWRGYGGYLF